MGNLTRRSLVASIICAPAIVRASSLMPVKVWRDPFALLNTRLAEAYAQTQLVLYANIMKESFHWVERPGISTFSIIDDPAGEILY